MISSPYIFVTFEFCTMWMGHLMKSYLILVNRKERRKQKEEKVTKRKAYEKEGYRKVHEFYF